VSPADAARLLALAELNLTGSSSGGQSGWAALARPDQLPPPGDWRTWAIITGRGWGKTRTGAETLVAWIDAGIARRIAIVAKRDVDLDGVMIPAILEAAGPGVRYLVSKRRLVFPNGPAIYGFSAEEPDSIRGYQFDTAWCDELASFTDPEPIWKNLQLALRIGHARQIVTTTPKPIPLLRKIIDDPRTVVTSGRTADNVANLSADSVTDLYRTLGGTRLGRQELEGELILDIEGALWERVWIDGGRVGAAPVTLVRIVVAIDPAMSSDEGADETGIVVVAKGDDGHAYVLADRSGRYRPDQWARIAVMAYHEFRADCIIAERNQGGDLVEETLRVVDPTIPYKGVVASRGKRTRAEPISALYEQNRVHHVGTFEALEDQLCSALPDGGDGPDDRLDALVWGISELDLGGSPLDEPGAIDFAFGVWPCPCGHRFTWVPGRPCPECGTRAADTYDHPIPGWTGST
jgi:phage terminase large subunit-like protein